MDYQAIASLVGSLGFPIVACIYMVYVNNEQSKAHKEEVGKMTEAINDLKVAIATLVEKLNN